MYYSLILISFGFFITKLSFYHLFLTISLALIIKLKIILEEKYLNKKFKNFSSKIILNLITKARLIVKHK